MEVITAFQFEAAREWVIAMLLDPKCTSIAYISFLMKPQRRLVTGMPS